MAGLGRSLRRGIVYALKLAATIVLAVFLFPLELLVSLVASSNEVGSASAAIRALWRDPSSGPREPRGSGS